MSEKYEQLKIMKVIQFPNNKKYENKIYNKKIDAALQIIGLLADRGCDFRIVIDKNSASEIFDWKEKIEGNFILTTSDFEHDKHFKADATNSELYIIQGDEFD